MCTVVGYYVYYVMYTQLYAETRPPVIWTGKNCCGRVEIWVDGWWTGKNMKEQKKFLRSECKWCDMCVCSPFHVIRHILKFVKWLNS